MWNFIENHPWQTLIIINYIFVLFAVFSVLLKNSNPVKTMSYIIVLVVFPFFGLIVYYFFGQQYRKQKIFNRKKILNQSVIKRYNEAFKLDDGTIDYIEENLLDEKIKLVKLLNNCKDSPLTKCNNVTIIKNGENIIPSLIEDIEQAKDTVHLEYYILKDDVVGIRIIDALCKKASEGVAVKLIYDYVGSSISTENEDRMKASGIHFYPFMPVYFPRFASKLNYRNHRKIAVIDGKIGYVGGVNLSKTYYNGENDWYWRDTHLRIVGEAVGSLQMQFFTTWDFVCDEPFEVISNHFPSCKEENITPTQIVASGPDTDWANIMEVIFTAINLAEDYVYITTPYFIPNDQILTAICTAARSGVTVKLLIPKESDSWAAKYASYSYISQLLEAGVQVHLYTKGFVHAKTLVVDDIFATVGTSNMDYRSFNINFEVNAVMYDKDKALELKKLFFEDLETSESLTYKTWKKRGFQQKFKESFSRLWAPLL